MLLHTEVYQLVILYNSIIVIVISENITHNIENLVLTLMQHADQKLSNFTLLKFLVIVCIERDDLHVDHLPHCKREFKGSEVITLMFDPLALQFDVPALLILVLLTSHYHLSIRQYLIRSIRLRKIGHRQIMTESTISLRLGYIFLRLKQLSRKDQCVRKKPRNVAANCIVKKNMNNPLITFSRVSSSSDCRNPVIHTPVRNPPRCPQQSMLPVLGVKMSTKISRKKNIHKILQRIPSPTRCIPTQLMIMYPNTTPIIPNNAVDAPAFKVPSQLPVSTASEKILPPIPQMMYITSVRSGPKVCSTRVTKMKVEKTFPMKCQKVTCTNTALSNRYTCPQCTSGPLFAPNSISEASAICSKSPLALIPYIAYAVNIAVSARRISIVTDSQSHVGQNAYTSMSQQFSSRGFFNCRLPEMNSTRFYSAYRSCCSVTGELKPSQGAASQGGGGGRLRFWKWRQESGCGGSFMPWTFIIIDSKPISLIFYNPVVIISREISRLRWEGKRKQQVLNLNVIIQLLNNMTEIKIEEIEQHFDDILALTGSDSFVNWETFTKSSTDFIRSLEELAKNIAILREIQQKKFITTMKRLKSADIPDLIKTVRSKKLPRQALKAIASRFVLNNGKIQLAVPAEELRTESKSLLQQYVSNIEVATTRSKDTVAFLSEKIKQTGLYEEPEVKELVSTFKHNFAEDKLEAAKGKIDIKYLPNTVDTLHISTYAQIVQNAYEVVKDQYKRLTEQGRKKQRALVKDTPKYLQAIVEYLTNSEVLILEGQKAIGAKLGLSTQRIEETEIALMEKGLGQNVLFIQSGLRTRVKQSISPGKDVELNKAKQVLKFQVGLLTSRVDYFRDLFSTMERNQDNLQLVPMIMALALNDMVFQEYALEEEDIMKYVTDQIIMTNPDFNELFKDMEVRIIKLMEQIGVIPEQISQYMQNQASLPYPAAQTNQQQPNPAFLSGGLLPGSNPMDLLQLQQFYQMQQMQQQAKK